MSRLSRYTAARRRCDCAPRKRKRLTLTTSVSIQEKSNFEKAAPTKQSARRHDDAMSRDYQRSHSGRSRWPSSTRRTQMLFTCRHVEGFRSSPPQARRPQNRLRNSRNLFHSNGVSVLAAFTHMLAPAVAGPWGAAAVLREKHLREPGWYGNSLYCEVLLERGRTFSTVCSGTGRGRWHSFSTFRVLRSLRPRTAGISPEDISEGEWGVPVPLTLDLARLTAQRLRPRPRASGRCWQRRWRRRTRQRCTGRRTRP